MPQEISAEPKKDDPSLKAKPPEDTSNSSGLRAGVQQSGTDQNTGSSGTVRNMSDVISSSLDAKFGGGGGGEQTALSDKVFAPPGSNFHWNAREHTIQANLAEGRPSVTNMTYTVSDSSGGTRQISGPAAYNNRGQQYLVDHESGQRYRITPPGPEGGQATLTPFNRGERGEPLKVVAQQAVDGWSPRPRGDWQPPQVKPVKDGADGGPPERRPAPPVVPDAQTAPKPGQVGPAAGPRNEIGGQQPPQADQQGGWRQRGPNDAAPPQAQLAQVIGNAMLARGAQGPLSDASRLPGGPARPGAQDAGDALFRSRPPMGPQQLDNLRQQLQLQQNPQALADALAKVQHLQQALGQPGQIAQLQQLQGQVGDRGKGQQQFSPQEWQQFQLQQVAKLQQQPGQQLDPSLRNLLTEKGSQPALQLLLNELRSGRMPGDQMLQNNRPLNELIKGIGPEGLVDIRRVMLMNADGTASGIKPLDGRMDLTSLNPRSRELLELIAGQLRPNAGALASERMLDVVRLNGTEGKQLSKLPDTENSRNNILELAKILRDMNLQNLDGKPISMRDLVSRSIDLNGERRDFIVKLDLMQGVKQENRLDSKGEPRTTEIKTDGKVDTRFESKVDPKTESKVDPKTESKVDAKLDLVPKVEHTVRPERPEATIDPFAHTKEVQARRDDLPVKKDERLHEEPQHKHQEVKPVRRPDEPLPVDQAALAAALAEKKRKDLDEKNKDKEQAQEKDKKEAERRQKYIVRAGDTLESVAGRMLRDKRLAGLIYEINKDSIPVVVIDRKKVPQLQERSVIWLPTPTEVKHYRGRLLAAAADTRTEYASAEEELEARFGKNWNAATAATTGGAALEDLEDAAKAAYANRRKHIENLLGPLSSKGDSSQPKYVVRLGETLKSVAMKHPGLQDVTLWKLLAELNGLSTETDAKGNPQAKLARGQTIILPSAAEIASFRQRDVMGTPRTRISGVLELPTRTCGGCKRQTFAAASLCPGCGRKFEDAPAATKSGAESRTAPVIKSPPKTSAAAFPNVAAGQPNAAAALPNAAASPATSSRPIEPLLDVLEPESATASTQPAYSLHRQFSEAARLMTAGTPQDLNTGYRVRLEVLVRNQWKPFVVYEIYTGTCMRHELTADGQRKSLRIDLPPQAAIELANNDIETNWKAYEERIRSTHQP